MMNSKIMYGNRLSELLKQYKKNEPLAKSGFFMFENLEENSLLFIGINPSEVKNIENNYSVIKENDIFWAKENFKNEYPFYRPFDGLSCGMKWSHLDLFFSCEKSQKKLENIIETEFFNDQLKISIEIIQKLMPKIIVVGNALASRLIQNKFDCKFDNEIGTYRIKKINNIPIFFSGMFTGQRALDVGSRKRLEWHISFVKEKIK